MRLSLQSVDVWLLRIRKFPLSCFFFAHLLMDDFVESLATHSRRPTVCVRLMHCVYRRGTLTVVRPPNYLTWKIFQCILRLPQNYSTWQSDLIHVILAQREALLLTSLYECFQCICQSAMVFVHGSGNTKCFKSTHAAISRNYNALRSMLNWSANAASQ